MKEERFEVAEPIFAKNIASFNTLKAKAWLAFLKVGDRHSLLLGIEGAVSVRGDLLSANTAYAFAVLPKFSSENEFYALMCSVSENSNKRSIKSIGRGGTEQALLILAIQQNNKRLNLFTIIESLENVNAYSHSEVLHDGDGLSIKNVLRIVANLVGQNDQEILQLAEGN